MKKVDFQKSFPGKMCSALYTHKRLLGRKGLLSFLWQRHGLYKCISHSQACMAYNTAGGPRHLPRLILLNPSIHFHSGALSLPESFWGGQDGAPGSQRYLTEATLTPGRQHRGWQKIWPKLWAFSKCSSLGLFGCQLFCSAKIISVDKWMFV